jgi:catalase
MSIIQFTQRSLLSILFNAAFFYTASSQQTNQRSSPAELVDALHTAFGDHHSRAVHAKGIILNGIFTPAKDAAEITKAAHLQKQSSKIVIRFSDFTGIPDIPDNVGGADPRGLAVKFIMPDGSTTDIVAHSFNGFPTATSDQFRELLLAIGASSTDTAKPNAVEKFLATHPVAKTFLTTQHTPASYGTINYFAVNAFKFTNKSGVTHFIRYRFVTEEGEHFLSADEMSKRSSDYLIKEIGERVSSHPVRFKLYAQIAEDGDIIDDPSIAWPESRKMILLGVIEIQKLSINTVEEDKGLSFIPNNIPAGIETADPMLDFRSKAYPISIKERQ